MRCSVCDFEEHGRCDNYQMDRVTLNGFKNFVFYDKKRSIDLCCKCSEAIELTKEEYQEVAEDQLLPDYSIFKQEQRMVPWEKPRTTLTDTDL